MPEYKVGDTVVHWIYGSGKIVGIETVDKMTDHQIAAKVRDHFQA